MSVSLPENWPYLIDKVEWNIAKLNKNGRISKRWAKKHKLRWYDRIVSEDKPIQWMYAEGSSD